ncbi:aminotransferase class I/II-fold pyridoxal phosphate-dependent enzyme [Oceanobacillus senegalensis]|uniref:aminotransferase class I/II-fold pyridoxal phosphate-dependent enzyme n=1 Tax=Oceanobacillus senegalensis TaxID=1936063 RepID=UPI000A30D3EF|nr:aminotransferase class I/II-fold pyridoxal phosphate-dependent enzyme [Oceanobacillus senegalensis]
MNQGNTPLYNRLKQFREKNPISFHVPGHKNGEVFFNEAREDFENILQLDFTELTGLDDLHAPTGVIQESQELAAEFFHADETFFLVGGSTSGNLAMILACCQIGDKVIVQRNSHKSIMNALELSGAEPIFIAPDYDSTVERYTNPRVDVLKEALHKHPDVKAIVLTYPDYFGKTYDIKRMIDLAHEWDVPVLVDEAHGVHFSLGSPLPSSALLLGADVVIQSAHKMAPAMTQGSYLHIKTDFPLKDRIAYYLQMIQSSSPSYPIMASLDIARAFLANISQSELVEIRNTILHVRTILEGCKCWEVLPLTENSDFLKITLHVKHFYSITDVGNLLEEVGLFPELITDNQILLIFGLAPYKQLNRLKKAVKTINERLKKDSIHATIDISKLFATPIQQLALTYQEMNQLTYKHVSFEDAVGKVAAEAVIPYPPGIPFILKGERVMDEHILTIQHLISQGVKLQQREHGMKVYCNN